MSDPFKPGTPRGRRIVPGGEVLRRYADSSGPTRFFLWLRWLWTPYGQMASLLPARGRILDGGSGHGLLSLTLALQSPARKVIGLDHSTERVAAAKKAAGKLPNVVFKKGDFLQMPSGSFEGLAFVDVLHYLTYPTQAKLLKDCYRRLRRGGVLLFRDVDPSPGLTSSLNRVHETIMTGLGFTKAGGLHFRTVPEWTRLAEEAGFRVRSKPTGRFPFADVLFWCRKP